MIIVCTSGSVIMRADVIYFILYYYILIKMKKTLKNICGMSLVLALWVLSFLVVDGNESVEAAPVGASTKITINWWKTCECRWKTGAEFNFGSKESTGVAQTAKASADIQVKVDQAAPMWCWITAGALSWTSSSIAKTNLQMTWGQLTNIIWNLVASDWRPSTLTAADWVYSYMKDTNQVWEWEQKITLTLTVPAYTIPWAYTWNMYLEPKCTEITYKK